MGDVALLVEDLTLLDQEIKQDVDVKQLEKKRGQRGPWCGSWGTGYGLRWLLSPVLWPQARPWWQTAALLYYCYR